MSASSIPNILAGLDLAAALGSRLIAIVEAAQHAAGEGRDLTSDELQVFVDADDAARDRLQAKIDAAKAAGR